MKKIFIISIGYVPVSTPSDKQFVLDVVEDLSNYFEVTVWTLNDIDETKNGKLIKCPSNNGYKIYNRNRVFHTSLGMQYKPHPIHSSIRNGIEVNLSFIWYLATHLRKTISECKPDIIHISDSIGPVVWLIKLLYKDIPITITKPTVRLSSSVIYNIWIWLSLKKADAIFTFTKSAFLQLKNIGLNSSEILVIPWGVRIAKDQHPQINTALIRKRYKCADDELLIVLLPRVIGDELVTYIKCFKEKFNHFNARFVFAIRPTRYLDSLSNLGSDNFIIESGPDDFYDVLTSADLAIADVGSQKGILSSSLLPLAWMESMLRRTPVFTNDAPGVEELILNNHNGLIYKDDDDLIQKLNMVVLGREAGIDIVDMGKNGRRNILERFNTKIITEEYKKIWKIILGK